MVLGCCCTVKNHNFPKVLFNSTDGSPEALVLGQHGCCNPEGLKMVNCWLLTFISTLTLTSNHHQLQHQRPFYAIQKTHCTKLLLMLRNKNDNNTIQAGIESGLCALEIPCAIFIYLSQLISDVHTLGPQ